MIEELRGKELYRFILKGKVLSALEIVQLTGYTYGGVMGTIQRLRKTREIKEVDERLAGKTGRPTKFYTWSGA